MFSEALTNFKTWLELEGVHIRATNNPLAYLKAVKYKYDEFGEIMKDFKAQR